MHAAGSAAAGSVWTTDAFVFLTLGQIRPYKGIDELITAFRGVPGAHLRLIVAGHPHNDAYAASLASLAGDDARIRLQLHYVPDEDIQYYLRAADFCVLPYRRGTTSGAAILCFSFGKPVIAPDVWPFRPLLAERERLLYANITRRAACRPGGGACRLTWRAPALPP